MLPSADLQAASYINGHFRAIARLGPVKVTLADVAAEAGVTAASLVQRFGSKRALLLAAAADAAGGIDLTDRDFLEHAQAGSLGYHAGITGLLRDARAAGELKPCDLPRLARAIQATLNGSLLDWAIHRQGTMAAWVRRDLKMVLGPYLVG